jgi:hypothetical protein
MAHILDLRPPCLNFYIRIDRRIVFVEKCAEVCDPCLDGIPNIKSICTIGIIIEEELYPSGIIWIVWVFQGQSSEIAFVIRQH